jgi:hypothetical protein
MEAPMPKAYFEPENLNALTEVFAEVRRRLSAQDINDPTKLDLIATRILGLAADGLTPSEILREIAPQVEPMAPFIAQEDAKEQSEKATQQSIQQGRSPSSSG